MAILQDNFIGKIIAKIKEALADKQDTLVSGTNIKTINGNSLLGSGDVSIEGGGNFDSSGTYPNLTAGKATKLATARKIGITGGAVGTATNFDGSGNINIPVSKVSDTAIQRVTSSNDYANFAKGLIPLDAVSPEFSYNRFEYSNHNAFTYEYSNDGGSTWVVYPLSDESKFKFKSSSHPLYLGNNSVAQIAGQDLLRITIDCNSLNTSYLIERLLIKISTSGAKVETEDNAIKCKLEYSKNSAPDVIIDGGTWILAGWPNWSKLPIIAAVGHTAASYLSMIRLTFSYDGYISGYENKTKTQVLAIRAIANTVYTNLTGFSIVETGRIYTPDYEGSVTFPKNVTATKHTTKGGTNQQAVLGDGSLIPLSELSPITDADADILLDNHIHSINVNTNGNNVNISVIESSKNGDNWETEDNDIPIPLATTTSAGVMSKEDKAKLDGGNVAIDDDSGMPDLIGDYYDDVDMVAEISLRQYYQPLTEGCLYLINAIEGGSQCIIMFIYRSDGCIPISTTNTNTMKASISGTTLKITGTDGSGELRIKQIKLK